MQATVHRFDATTTTGSVLTDVGVIVPFGADAFASSGLRHLRIGQRLTITVEGSGAAASVTSLHLGTVGSTPKRSSRP